MAPRGDQSAVNAGRQTRRGHVAGPPHADSGRPEADHPRELADSRGEAKSILGVAEVSNSAAREVIGEHPGHQVSGGAGNGAEREAAEVPKQGPLSIDGSNREEYR